MRLRDCRFVLAGLWLAAAGVTAPSAAARTQDAPDPALCPSVSDLDASRLASVPLDPAVARAFREMRIPRGDPARPNRPVVMLQGLLLPGGGYRNTVWSFVWKERDGVWRFWRQDRDPDRLALVREHRPSATEAQAWPAVSGRLSAAQAERLDRALADPCRALEPDVWPLSPPVRVAPADAAAPLPSPPPPYRPPLDYSPRRALLHEPGRPSRPVAGTPARSTLNGVLAEIATGPVADL